MTLFPVPPSPPRTVPVKPHFRKLRPRDMQPKARSTDPETSHNAAQRSFDVTAENNRGKALLAHLEYGAMTDFELAERVHVPQTSIGVRRKELVMRGWVEKVEGKTRPSPSGTASQVWRITKTGRAEARRLKKERDRG